MVNGDEKIHKKQEKSSMADEKVFFDNGAVKVTNSRFATGSKTFAMNTITSVEPLRETLNWKLLIIGLITIPIGIGFLILAWVIYTLVKPLYFVETYTAAGKSHAMSSRNKEVVFEIVEAINNAIIHRG